MNARDYASSMRQLPMMSRPALKEVRVCIDFDPSRLQAETMTTSSSPSEMTLSSPPSSPNPYRFSSSPMASPAPTTTSLLGPAFELDERPVDPFSGTSRSSRPPPLYEKGRRIRARSPTDSSPGGARKRARLDSSTGLVSAQTSPFGTPSSAPKRYTQEENTWNDAITAAFDAVNPIVDLACVSLHAPVVLLAKLTEWGVSEHNLTYISPQIASLADLVVLQPLTTVSPSQRANAFGKTSSLPAIGSPTSRVAERAATVSSVTLRAGRQHMGHVTPVDLFLYQNRIRTLPVELFRVVNLRVLSLRKSSSFV